MAVIPKRRLSTSSGSSGGRWYSKVRRTLPVTPVRPTTSSARKPKRLPKPVTYLPRMKRVINYRAAKQLGQYAGRFSTRKRGNMFARYTKNGAVTTEEVGSVLTGTVNTAPLYVGHATHADSKNIQKLFFLVLVRALLEKAGLSITDFQEGVGSYEIILNAVVQNEQAAPTNIVETTSGKTVETIASNLQATSKALWNTVGGQNVFYFISAEMNTVGLAANNHTVAMMDLRDIRIQCLSKSDLKIQNRTVATGTDEDTNTTENVANQPLYGKSYMGKGTGLYPKQSSLLVGATPLNCTTQFGTVLYATTAADVKYYGEPPLPTLFTPRPKYSNASLEPGKIKTSVLIAKMSILQKDFWKALLVDNTTVLTDQRAVKYGKYHIFALEKNICVSAADSQPTIGIECNQRMGMIFTKAVKQHVPELFLGQTFI